jgi:hypothetical protein
MSHDRGLDDTQPLHELINQLDKIADQVSLAALS